MAELPVAITHYCFLTDNVTVIKRVETVAEANVWIGWQRMKDPLGVERGDYGIDAPEEMVNPPKIKPRAPAYVIKHLEEALRKGEMESARFGMPYDMLSWVNGPRTGEPARTLDDVIKKETEAYRRTWLIPEIEAALKWARGE